MKSGSYLDWLTKINFFSVLSGQLELFFSIFYKVINCSLLLFIEFTLARLGEVSCLFRTISKG